MAAVAVCCYGVLGGCQGVVMLLQWRSSWLPGFCCVFARLLQVVAIVLQCSCYDYLGGGC